ncbi:Zeaxanthin epoxidase, chloroplastic [Madurella fahalii]|uniref:Zeaxanthin epoxidase, chloroplastic n=1 Tax=Madurella fahalii TaxID=1157608 RepID=A0ABQ0GFH9_9PEZI
MTSFPKSVIIVGGSLAGLMHGLYLKRYGSNVVILEQDPSDVRSSHLAGVAFGPAVEELLKQCDDTGLRNCTPSAATRLAYHKNQDLMRLNVVRHQSSWGLLYRILRANFDGLVSDAVPNPPPPRPGDGSAEYRAGKRVTKLDYNNGTVVVGFVGQDGREESLTADFVIGADGVHSIVRTLLEVPVTKEYSGYVAWRGTVSEGDVSPEVVKYFENYTSFNFLKHTYIVCYIIPPDTPSFTPGTRLINWVWYYNLPAASPELTAVLTDTANVVHGNTVPSGLVRQEIWQQHLATTLPQMAAPYAELIAATRHPFVTKVNDALCEVKPVFKDAKVVLVGDALAAFRPHFAVAAEQAARHALALGKVWKGEMSMEEWGREVWTYGKRMWLASRVLGIFGLGGWWDFLKILGVYVAFLVRLKLRRE